MTTDKLEKLAEKYVKSSVHKSDPYCELGYYHPMRKGFTAGYTARDSEVQALVEALKFECGNRCSDLNPCNAKDALAAHSAEETT